MPARYSCLFALLTATLGGAVSAADITIEKFDVFDDSTHHLHIEGPIVPGDAAYIRALTNGLPRGRNEILAVSLNSPGGSVVEGLEIARDLQAMDLQVVTDVMMRDGAPGECASACAYIFVGGTFRFLNDGSRLGVHQFAYVDDALTLQSETAREVQARSADITSLLSDASVDPGFFSLMGATAPEEMTWVDLQTLERFNVVNRERAYQENAFSMSDGTMRLVMTHIGLYGINRITARCSTDDVMFTSEVFLSDGLTVLPSQSDAEAIAGRFQFSVRIDGYMASPEIVEPAVYVDQGVNTAFRLTDAQLATMMTAEKIDVRLVESSGIFIGAAFDVSDRKVSDLIKSCVALEPQATSGLGGNRDIETALSPVYVAASLGAVRRGEEPPESAVRSIPPEDMARDLYVDYLAAWSEPNDAALPLMDARYADIIDFYGAEITKSEVMADKVTFAERWPERRYAARPDTFEISCPSSSMCIVASIIDWEAQSAAREASASGVAWYGLGFDMQTGQVLFENGESRKR